MQQLILQSQQQDNLTIGQRQQQLKPEGFEQQEHLSPVRNKNSTSIKEAIDTFYKIPEAKPLLSKAFIDYSKPKVLIKEVHMCKEPDQLIAYKISPIPQQHSPQKNSPPKPMPRQFSFSQTYHEQQSSNSPTNLPNSPFFSPQKQPIPQLLTPCTLWQKYIIKSGYECVYLKYLREAVREEMIQEGVYDEGQRKEMRKKLKLELLKMCHNNQHLFNTYFIDLDFITEAGTTLIRNLIDCKIDALYSKWQQSFESAESPQPSIQFDSRFQCGNLFAVYQKVDKRTFRPSEPRTFDLILQNDTNTKGYTAWFYFSVKSIQKGKLKFNLVNMHKNHSFYTSGMKVLVFSYQRYKTEQVEWYRNGYNFTYKKNEIMKHPDDPNQRYNTLSFCLDQKYDNDIIYIAANIPYSYSRLVRFLDSVEKVARLNSSIYLKKQTHINSISSNTAPVLTLTWKRDKKDKTTTQKKIIAIIARQHPSQTASSFVMEGIINSLVYMSSQYSVELLKKYIFKIIPMFNVDGVIYGSSRCDISGSDVNRKWTKHPNSFLYPVTSSAKKMYHQLINEGYEIDYFIDLHGHSKKLGTFIYSCKVGDQVESRMLSWVMSKICNKFAIDNCIFGLANSKKETARGSMLQLVNGRKSITVQTSFYGWKRHYGNAGSTSNNNGVIKHFDIKDLHEIGENLLSAIYADHSRDPKLYNWPALKNEIRTYLESTQKSLQSEDDLLSESGSDSSPDVHEMNFQEKTSCFLPPTVATKIGLAQIKIVQRVKVKEKPENFIQKEQNHKFQALDGFGHQHEEENHNDDIHLKSFFSNNFQRNNTLEPKLLRETKSVTKISPFKFTQRNRKSFSTKKIRIAIDVKYVEERKQKVSVPSLLPQIEEKKQEKAKKKNFWRNFNKEYESLVKERENMFMKKYKEIAEGCSTQRGDKILLGIKSLK